MIVTLPTLLGDQTVLDRARRQLREAPAAVAVALDELEATAELARQRRPGLVLGFDLCELHGYNYHTGTVFSAYAENQGQAMARGGRYDDIGGAFGRARPATGFDLDLKVLSELVGPVAPLGDTVTLPVLEGLPVGRLQALWESVATLRGRGVRVVPGESAAAPAAAELTWDGASWVLTNRLEGAGASED